MLKKTDDYSNKVFINRLILITLLHVGFLFTCSNRNPSDSYGEDLLEIGLTVTPPKDDDRASDTFYVGEEVEVCVWVLEPELIDSLFFGATMNFNTDGTEEALQESIDTVLKKGYIDVKNWIKISFDRPGRVVIGALVRAVHEKSDNDTQYITIIPKEKNNPPTVTLTPLRAYASRSLPCSLNVSVINNEPWEKVELIIGDEMVQDSLDSSLIVWNIGSEDTIGVHEVSVTAKDYGDPPEATTKSVHITVIEDSTTFNPPKDIRVVERNDEVVVLTWKTDSLSDGYTVLRSSDIDGDTWEILGTTTDSTFTDTTDAVFYYRVVTENLFGSSSEPGTVVVGRDTRHYAHAVGFTEEMSTVKMTDTVHTVTLQVSQDALEPIRVSISLSGGPVDDDHITIDSSIVIIEKGETAAEMVLMVGYDTDAEESDTVHITIDSVSSGYKSGIVEHALVLRSDSGQDTAGEAELVITTQPSDTEIECGNDVKFFVTASDTTVDYQWFKEDDELPDATSDSVILTSVDGTDAGSYRCKICNANDCIWTDGCTLHILLSPPEGLHVYDRSASILSLAWETVPCASWYCLLRAEGVGAFAILDTIDTIAVTDTSLAAGTEYHYRIIAGNGDDVSDTSEIYTDSTWYGPVIIKDPEPKEVLLGQPCTLTVAAKGNPACTCQWFKNGTQIDGATSTQFVLSATAVSDSGRYHVAITNSVETMLSDTVHLSVQVLLTVSCDPVEGGITEPTGSDNTVEIGNALNIEATPKNSYMFKEWKIISGTPQIDNAASSKTTVTLSEGNGEIVAHFVEKYSTMYVDSSAINGTKDGLSWANAFTDFQDALSKAIDGSIIYIAQGIYFPASVATNRTVSFNVSKKMVIYGGYASGGTTRDPRTYRTILSGELQGDNDLTNNFLTIVTINNCTEIITIDGLEITGGYDNLSNGGGVDVISGNIVLNNCIVSSNSSTVGGGGIFLSNGSLKMNECKSFNNSCMLKVDRADYTGSHGGAIYMVNSTAEFSHCVFDTNNVSSTAEEIDIFKSYGGAIFCDNSAVTCLNCSFNDNSCSSSNGGFVSSSLGYGGALSIVGGSLVLSEVTFNRNSILGDRIDFWGNGGAVYCDNISIECIHCSFDSNFIDDAEWGYGGAVMIENPIEVMFEHCIFTKNNCSTYDNKGGALYINEGSPEIIGCLFSYNTINQGNYGSNGGALCLRSSSAKVTNCTFYKNANLFLGFCKGGAIQASGAPSITNCTFTENQVEGDGGAIYFDDSGSVINCIMWNDTALDSSDEDEIVKNKAFIKNCIIQHYFGSSDSIYGDYDPMLLDLGDYGCSTQIIPIPANSFAKNKGTGTVPNGVDISTDACGNPRDDGSPDIGAYEVQ